MCMMPDMMKGQQASGCSRGQGAHGGCWRYGSCRLMWGYHQLVLRLHDCSQYPQSCHGLLGAPSHRHHNSREAQAPWQAFPGALGWRAACRGVPVAACIAPKRALRAILVPAVLRRCRRHPRPSAQCPALPTMWRVWQCSLTVAPRGMTRATPFTLPWRHACWSLLLCPLGRRCWTWVLARVWWRCRLLRRWARRGTSLQWTCRRPC